MERSFIHYDFLKFVWIFRYKIKISYYTFNSLIFFNLDIVFNTVIKSLSFFLHDFAWKYILIGNLELDLNDIS